MHKMPLASLLLAAAWPLTAAHAQSTPDLQNLRQEIQTLRSDYEARLQALEARLRAAETGNSMAAPPAPPAPPAALPSEPGASGPTSAGSASAFNPSISLILSGLYARSSREPQTYRISGFALPPAAEIGPGTRGFSLSESELGLAASIDPWLQGKANFALHPDDRVSVEEAYVQTTSLGQGLTLKAGRFFSGVGYLNEQHAHTWDFVDNPLAYQALLGTQYGDDGLQLRWLAPTDLYFELGMELGRGRSFPGADNSRNGGGMAALTAHAGGDLGASNSWRAGISVLGTKADDQALQTFDRTGAAVETRFTGQTRVWMVDGVWKWAPEGNATQTHFKLQGEYLRSQRSGSLAVDPMGTSSIDADRTPQSGWYVQGIYQFMPRWRIALRTERLDPGAALHRPAKDSWMLDFSPSEFSRLRLQLARDRSRDGTPDQQLFLQYQTALGAHGAHSY